MVHMETGEDDFAFSSERARWKKQRTFLTSFIQPEASVDVMGSFHKFSWAYVIWWPCQSAEN